MSDLPDGITERHAAETRGLRAHASLLAFVILGGMIATAAAGLLGGTPAAVTTVATPAAGLTVKLARPLRSGLFFETRIVVTANRPIAKPVLGVDPGLWRDLTINSHIPAAKDERFEAGQYRFDYPALAAGETLVVKIDGQANPPLVGRLAGAITLYDGEAKLAEQRLSVPVLP